MSPSNPTPRTGGGKKGKKAPKRPQEATKPAGKPVGVLEPPVTGNGLLWRGKALHHVPGPGRPRDQIRADALEALTKGPGKLAQILDGVAYTTIVGKCKNCGHIDEGSAVAAPTEVKPADVVKAALALDKLAGEEGATVYAALFHRIRELTLELGGDKGPILLAAFHEAHRTLTEGR